MSEKNNADSGCVSICPECKCSFPSVLLMLALPAVVAGAERIIVTTPPNEEGSIDDTLLATAKICGISEIYKVGGIRQLQLLLTVPKPSQMP